jgi:putative tryptophan/tyrosine transport system substrate-binding protein
MFGMSRRDFVALLGGAAWPVAALAQQRALPLIGILNSGTEQLRPDQFDGLHRGLKETGFVAGTNVTVISRGAGDNYDRLPVLAAEFVRLPVAVIATAGGPVAALAAKAATSTIPIVFAAVSDPVKSGLVASLSRPGGNITGNAGFSIELDAKRLELLSELAPAARAIGALVNPNRPGVEAQEKEMLAAAKTAGRELTVLHTGDPRAIEIAFATLTERKIAALLIGADALFNNHRPQIVALAARHGIIAMYPWNEFVTEGGLVSYAPSLTEAYRLSGLYVGRILNGEKPADLPVMQPTKVELAINLKTARALGLTPPPTLLARADQVIE